MLAGRASAASGPGHQLNLSVSPRIYCLTPKFFEIKIFDGRLSGAPLLQIGVQIGEQIA